MKARIEDNRVKRRNKFTDVHIDDRIGNVYRSVLALEVKYATKSKDLNDTKAIIREYSRKTRGR